MHFFSFSLSLSLSLSLFLSEIVAVAIVAVSLSISAILEQVPTKLRQPTSFGLSGFLTGGGGGGILDFRGWGL